MIDNGVRREAKDFSGRDRRTDVELLAQYGTPVLAHSGAAPELLPALHAANLVNASQPRTDTSKRAKRSPLANSWAVCEMTDTSRCVAICSAGRDGIRRRRTSAVS